MTRRGFYRGDLATDGPYRRRHSLLTWPWRVLRSTWQWLTGASPW